MLPGECLCSGAQPICYDCGVTLQLEVLRSNAGYYIGSQCECGPYSRESGYFRTREEAQHLLTHGGWIDRAGQLR